MKRTSILLIVLGLGFLILAGLVTQKQKNGLLTDAPGVKREVERALASQQWNAFKNTAYNYSFNYPETWDAGGTQLTAITVLPTKTTPPGGLLVLVLDGKNISYVDEYQKLYKQNYASGNCQITDDAAIASNGKKLACSDSSGAKLTSYFGEYKGQLYQVLYYTEFTYADGLNDVFQKIVDSFAFTASV